MTNRLTGSTIPGQVFIAFRNIPLPIKTQLEGKTVLTFNLVPVAPGKSLLAIFDYRKGSLTAFENYQRDKDLKRFKEALNSPALIGVSKVSDGLHDHFRIFLEDTEQKELALLSISRFKCDKNKGCQIAECNNPEFWYWTAKVAGNKGETEEIVVTFTDKDNCVAVNPPFPIHGYPEQVFVMRDRISLADKKDYFKE